MSQFIAQLHTQMPHLQFTNYFLQFFDFNQQPTPNAKEEGEEEDEDKDDDLEDD